MDYFYVNVNAQSSGEHEVHKSTCKFLPDMRNCIKLGLFYNARTALIEARRYYKNVDGCYYCLPEIHKK